MASIISFLLNVLLLQSLAPESCGIRNANLTIQSKLKTFQYNEPALLLDDDIFGLDRSQHTLNPQDFGGVDLQKEAGSMSNRFRLLTRDELGVGVLQGFYDELNYENLQPNYPQILHEFVTKLENKLERYLTVLRTNKFIVENLYPKSAGGKLNNCCLIQQSQLKYDELYGTGVTRQTSCDLVPASLQETAFNPGRNLTDVFQHITQHSIKWQYFVSAQGVHNEFPAHDFDGVLHRDCQTKHDERHRAVYVSTVYPQRKNVVVMIDTGRALLSAAQLSAAKAAARHILLSLSENDRVSVLNVNSEVSLARGDDCLTTRLCPLTYEAKLYFSNFIQHLKKRDSATNHTLGFEKAFKVIWNTLLPENSGISEEQAMIVYISPGVLSNFTEAREVMKTIAYENARLRHKVVINTFAVGDHRPVLFEEAFLRNLALQDFGNYGVEPQYPGHILPGQMVSLKSTEDLSIRVGNFSDAFQWLPSRKPRISLPSKDDVGKGVVIPITWPCYHAHDLVGVVGLDIYLADIVEDVTYFSTPSGNAYAFLIDMNGFVIMHPALPRPVVTTIQPIHTNITHLEPSEGFKNIFPVMLQQLNGSKICQDIKSPNTSTSSVLSYINVTYTWKHVYINMTQWQQSVYIMVLKTVQDDSKIASKVSSHTSLVYHRIDLLPADGMCIHLKQLATTDTSVLFLSASSFLHPFDHLTDTETKQMVKNYLAYLKYNDLIADPDDKGQAIREVSRKDVATISQINTYWTLQYRNSPLNDYIVRRYVATPTGAMYIFPGTLLSKTYDATRQDWYKRALEFPGKMTLTAPYLDRGGAGYIVTISHTIHEAKAAASPGSGGRVVAVMGLDVTLGYLYKLLTEQIGVCGRGRHTRCFLMDDRGYLIAHPGLIEPNGLGPVEGKHVTHKEALVAADILNHVGFVEKKLCNSYGDRTIQRLYHFNTSIENVLTNLKHGEQCSKYQMSSVPGTNVFIGMVNQTCDNVKAFCPCSVVDRMCLNCHRMEQTECECPCECPLQMDFCSGDILHASDRNPSCPRPQEGNDARVVSRADGSLDRREAKHLPPCYLSHCEQRKTKKDCMGVLDCEWCYFDLDGVTELREPFCSTQRTCFAGVLGAATPYGDQKPPPETHIEKPYPSQSTPVGPVAGGIMACFLVLALGVYCYCHRVHRSGHQYASTLENQYRLGMEEQLEDLDPENEGHIGLGGGHTNVVLATFDSPSVSPYRVNTGYRRPAAANGHHTESDLGYSTMTPHDDSEIASTCLEPVLIGRERYRPGRATPKPSTDTPILPPPPSGRRSQSPVPPAAKEACLLLSQSTIAEHTVLSPKQGLSATVEGQTVLPPHQVLAPVQVHMVDLHS